MAGRGLGKGLGALLGDAALQTQENGSMLLPISQLEPNRDQPRKFFDENALGELADSIREHGILQPLVVRRLSSGYYQIIAGERRWRAARLAGLAEVPAVIVEATDRRAAEWALIENLQREDLNPIEEASGYRQLIDEYSLTQDEVASRMGKSRPAVSNALRLLALPESLRLLVSEGKLSAGHARTLLPLKAESVQKEIAKRVMEEELSVRQTESIVKAALSAKPKKEALPSREDAVDYIKDAEKQLASHLGRRVHIISGRKKGRLELEYYGVEDLNALLSALSRLPFSQKGVDD